MSELEKEASTMPVNNTQPKALRILASIISYICHPVFFPLVMAYVIYKLAPAGFVGLPPKQLGLWFLSIGITAVFFPLFSILLMKPLGFISSYHLPTAKERTIPLMTTMIFYFWVSHVFNSMPGAPAPLALKVLLLGNFWGIIALFIINIFTKVSLHTGTAGGMIGVILVLMITSNINLVVPLLVSIVIAGVIGSSRLILGAHQRGDVWVGYIIGILVQLFAYLYFK
jgi:hypothetical protein